VSPEQRTVIEVEGRRLSVSNLDKVLYPEAGFTKADVIWYYLHVAPVLLPHVQGRPLTVTRYPNGVTGESFFEKHTASKAPDWTRSVRVPRNARPDGTNFIEQLVLDDLPTLVWVANLAALELHVPQWRSVEEGAYGPVDLMVFDLDPGAPATVVECCAVANWLRRELQGRDLVAYPKTSGSKGLQLYARLDPPWPWEQAHAAAHDIARQMEREHPSEVLSNMRRDLRKGKVLIDWSQNHAAKTTIAPYSLRAQPFPTVSTPLTWEEVERGERGGGEALRFVAGDVLERVEAVGDLFAPLSATPAQAKAKTPARAKAKAPAKTPARAIAKAPAKPKPKTPARPKAKP
jgi:bifunctional non-homologous end joining protein LigD